MNVQTGETCTTRPAKTHHLGEWIGRRLFPGAVVCLQGDLGAGKTLLVKGIGRAFGTAEDEVTSPTFTLVHEYQGRIPLYHIDLYRLQSKAELADLGLDEYLYGDGVTLIEWPELLQDDLPAERLVIAIRTVDETTRQFRFTGSGEQYAALVRAVVEEFGDAHIGH